jgi:GH15 family glucan-1,4-alpha-glucosidase
MTRAISLSNGRLLVNFGEQDLAARYTGAAARMKAAVAQALWDDQTHRFARTAKTDQAGRRSVDRTLDASLVGLWYFGMLEAGDERVVATMEALRRRLRVRSPVGGMARYENDWYYRSSPDVDQIAGNPWFVCTLWPAQWHVRQAAEPADLEPAAAILKWAASRALPNGAMAEQIHPLTDEPMSACPLIWSHATFVLAVHEYVAKCRELHTGVQHLCGAK